MASLGLACARTYDAGFPEQVDDLSILLSAILLKWNTAFAPDKGQMVCANV